MLTVTLFAAQQMKLSTKPQLWLCKNCSGTTDWIFTMKPTSRDVLAAYYIMKGKQRQWRACQELFASIIVTNQRNKIRFTRFSVCLHSAGGSCVMHSSDAWKDVRCSQRKLRGCGCFLPGQVFQKLLLKWKMLLCKLFEKWYFTRGKSN